MFEDIQNRFAKHGYVLRQAEALALRGLLSHRGSGAAAALVTGLPGVGKTSLGETLAKAYGWPLVYGQLHAWSDADELFVGVDVAAAVAGASTEVRQDGLLACAARATQTSDRVVLILDEIDKTHERCEALLLDFLQTGRVPVRPGLHLKADLSKLVVFLTSNGEREVSDALLRRCRRLPMVELPVELQDILVERATGAPKGVVRICGKICRRHGSSVQEIAQATRECWELADCMADCLNIVNAWARQHVPSSAPELPALWGEVKAQRPR